MDNIYYYLRNSVILYSVFTFFVGYYFGGYLREFVNIIRKYFKAYVSVLLFFPVSRYLFERFGMATLFPALFKKAKYQWVLPSLIGINLIYSISYKSATTLILVLFYCVLLVSPGYRFFKQIIVVLVVFFSIFFIYIQPNLNIISHNYSVHNDKAIREVMESNPLLKLDGNTTWRLVLWKQIIIDRFPGNLLGMGLGTPIFKYFPVENISKLESLPYVIGAHNSFVYLFGRLGFVYIILTIYMYRYVFKEYFYFKKYYLQNNAILIFWSFFAISVIALFNPVLESPVYAGGYWMILGFVAKAINLRKVNTLKIKET
ncbi:MAG TPA: hypothetical protein VFN30_06745 [Chitinophagaceae bacterium]|nr:hypothetical protein [Chitinophagaceae bacterium]